jgi:hypothetical protein
MWPKVIEWTYERVEMLRQMRQIGRSAAQIALAIGHGCTRNAVIGKMGRLGVDKAYPVATSEIRRRAQAKGCETKRAKSERQREETKKIIAERAPISSPFMLLQKRAATARHPPQLALVSSVELPPAPVEKPVDLYAHMRSDDGLRRAIAAMARPPRDIRDGQGVSE